ncbi:MAG: carbohydrate kinase family protein [Candidatus Limnocylindria bacterium]
MIAGGPMRVAVIGDCLFDVSARPLGPLAPGADAPADIDLLPGGHAANVAVRLARRGVRVRLITPLADDDAAALLRRRMQAEGVELAPMPAPRTGFVLALLDDAGERTMLSSRTPLPRGVTVRHALKRQLVGVDWVHVAGQALADATGGAAVTAVTGALSPGVVRSVDAGSLPPDADAVARFRERLAASRAALLFCGRDAASSMLGAAAKPDETLSALSAALAASLKTGAIVTGAATGSAASVGGHSVTVPGYARDAPVVDATGAGDAYAAGVIVRLAGRGWPPSADELRTAMLAGSELGSRVARVRGAQTAVLGEPGLPVAVRRR